MKKLNRRKAATFILFIFLVFLPLTACENQGDFSGNPELTPYSKEIYVSEGWLYYDGPRRDAGLFAYNLETREKVKITKEQGTPLKTKHGLFYHVGMKIYRMDGLSLELLCVIPKETQFVDYVQGKVYWREGGKVLYEGTINAGGIVSEESVRTLYRKTEENGRLSWAKIGDEGAYLARQDGFYYLDFETLETECIFEGDVFGLVQSLEEEYLFAHSGQEEKELYMVSLKDYTVQKIADTKTDFALVCDGTVYHNGGGTTAYDLGDGSSKRLGDGVWSGAAAIYDHSLIMRHRALYSIYLFDISDGSCERIIDM